MISIIIPTLNEEKIIEETLRSLREYKGDYEIIVSDGRSTDKTIEIARKYADKVVVYEGATRQTIGMGRNLGASQASGDYLLFLDADMHIPDINNFFVRALDIFNKYNLVGLSAFLKVFPEMATLADKIVFGIQNYFLSFSNNVLHKGASSGEFQMIKASIFKELHGYDEKMVASEDYEFFKRLSKVGRTRVDSSLVVFHTGRRAHKIGWAKLLSLWFLNMVFVTFRKKAYSREWKVIR